MIEIALFWCPESPSYLFVTKGEREARDSLVRLQSESVADKYLGYIQEEIKASVSGGGAMGVIELLQSVALRKQLIVGVTVQLIMQSSGIDAGTCGQSVFGSFHWKPPIHHQRSILLQHTCFLPSRCQGSRACHNLSGGYQCYCNHLCRQMDGYSGAQNLAYLLVDRNVCQLLDANS